MPYKDPEKERAYKARWHNERKNDPNYYRRLKKSKPKAKQNARRYLIEHKAAKGCAFCKMNLAECLDFHHIDPSIKSYTLTQMGNSGFKVDKIDEEIAKCVVICANHHRLIEAAIKLRKSNAELFDKLMAQ